MSKFEKLEPLKPCIWIESGDVEEWTDVGKGIEVSCNTADEDLIIAVMNPDPESITLEKESSAE